MKRLFCLILLILVGCNDSSDASEFKRGELVILPITGQTGIVNNLFLDEIHVRHAVGTNDFKLTIFREWELRKIDRLESP